jgi:N-acetylmuramoyl-L-alanine amidase
VQALSDAIQKAKSAALSGQELDADQASGTQSGAQLKTTAGSYVIVLDPGHDATHAGARANGLNEEELTLKVATYCKEYLEANYTNVVVYMTRSTSACPYPGTTSGDDNAARVAAAAKVGADAYIAIHMDTTGTGATTASGAAVWYPNSNYNNTVGSQGSVLASKIVEQLAKAGMNNRGIKTRNSENNTTYADGSLADYYQIIRLSKEYGFPGVIVEHAFLNNASDAAFLKSEDNLKKLGVADALGIAAAYNLSSEEVDYDAEDLTVSSVDGANGSFDITLTGATPTARIAKICFKVYPTDNSSKSYLYTAEDKGDGTYTVTANVSNHGNLTGKYKIIAYAYDAAGKKTQLRSTTVTIEEAAADTAAMTLTAKPSSNQKKVTLTLKGNSGAADVYFKVYNKEKGSKTAKKVAAVKQKNGSWKAVISVADYKAAGEYTVLAYSTSYFGTTKKVKTGSFTIEGPTATKLALKSLNLSKGTFQLRAYGITSKSGVKKVSMTVQTLDGKKVKKTYTPKKKGSYYYINVDMKDFKYQFGEYKVTVSVTDGNEIQKTVLKSTQEVEQPEPEITAKLKSKETKISVKAEELGIGANIKGVRFTVYNTANTSKKKNYEAKKASDGSYSASINVSDFGLSGKYKIVTYVKNASGKYVKTGDAQTVTVADITGGTVKTKVKNDSSSYLYLSSVSCNTAIASVEVKAWPAGMSNQKYTYKASLRTDGSYRALIDSKNHDGTGGTYRYQVIVTGKNGIQKTLLKGTLELGESEADEGKYAISGTSQVTVAQMVAYYKKNATYPSYYADSDAPTITKFCKIYYDECQKEGIRVEVAFAQAMKETGFLRFGGDVDISQYNFAGIGATGGGEKGNSFPTVRTGIRAQIQHLKAYANSEPLVQAQVDPRFQYVTRGSAPYVEWLGIPDNPTGKGWATAQNYGSSILQMIRAIKSC